MTRSSCLLLPALLAGATVLLSAGSKPSAAPKGPTPKGGCAVCGMHVANFPEWAAVITFKDGAQAWFDGPKDLFTYLLDLKRYAAKRNPADITAIQVKDYYGLKHIDGRKAFYVMGSDVMGPMGKELVPFATEAGARDFLKDHQGQKILVLPEITLDTMKGLE
ncbi:MAG: nitrous oxide reductase accessory protein NosL [Geothrix sp.]|nr:nitrous oxide reductase accessory protein NosL [Geothrix sp.]